MVRRYRQRRRAETADETRRRIVRATFDLHSEKGILATSQRDIAQRADVAIGTVYHHFPRLDDVIEACGAYTGERFPAPGPEVLDGARDATQRLRRVVAAQCAYHRSFSGMARIRSEADRVAAVAAWLREDAARLRRLLALAVRPRRPPRRALEVAAAVLDIGPYESLRAGGLSERMAVDELSFLVRQRLLGPSPA